MFNVLFVTRILRVGFYPANIFASPVTPFFETLQRERERERELMPMELKIIFLYSTLTQQTHDIKFIIQNIVVCFHENNHTSITF